MNGLRAAALVLLAVALSGCFQSPVHTETPRDLSFVVASSLHQQHPDEPDPTETREGIAWGWDDYVLGNPPPVRDAGPFTSPVYVSDVQLDLRFSLENAGRPPVDVRPFSRPPLTAWFGTESGSVISHEFGDGPDVVTTYQEATASWAIDVPPGGMYVADGDSIAVMVGTYYEAGPNGAIELLTPGSTLSVHVEPAPRIGAVLDQGSASVDVQGGACVVRDPTGGPLDQALLDAAIEPVTLDVPAEAGFLEVRAFTDAGDMDFWLDDPAGTAIVHALGPGNQERVLLGPANLDGRAGTWTVHAYACSLTSGTIALEWTLWDVVAVE